MKDCRFDGELMEAVEAMLSSTLATHQSLAEVLTQYQGAYY
jgi:hypothetical protein